MAERPLIAIVDDEQPVRTMLRRALSLAHCDVVAFGSAEELLQSLKSGRPVCSILDVHLPGMSGLDVGECLRAAAIPSPIILITAGEYVSLDVTAAGALGRALGRPVCAH